MVVVIFFLVSSRGKFRHRKLFILALFSFTILGSGVHGRYRDDLSDIDDFKFDDDWSLSTSTYGVEVDFRNDVLSGVLWELTCGFLVFSAMWRLLQLLLRQQQHLKNSLLKLIVNIPGTKGKNSYLDPKMLHWIGCWIWGLSLLPICTLIQRPHLRASRRKAVVNIPASKMCFFFESRDHSSFGNYSNILRWFYVMLLSTEVRIKLISVFSISSIRRVLMEEFVAKERSPGKSTFGIYFH